MLVKLREIFCTSSMIVVATIFPFVAEELYLAPENTCGKVLGKLLGYPLQI